MEKTKKRKQQQQTMERELERLREENRRLHAASMAVADQAEEKMSYYYDLVWLARRTPEEYRRHAPDFFTNLRSKLGEEKFQTFMDDKDRLEDPDEGGWYHGFNSGVLATARLFLGLVTWQDEEVDGEVWTAESERQQAVEDFPMLDT